MVRNGVELGLVGATQYGFPLPWLIRLIIAPGNFPWRVNGLGLFVDIVLWFVLTGVVLHWRLRLVHVYDKIWTEAFRRQ